MINIKVMRTSNLIDWHISMSMVLLIFNNKLQNWIKKRLKIIQLKQWFWQMRFPIINCNKLQVWKTFAFLKGTIIESFKHRLLYYRVDRKNSKRFLIAIRWKHCELERQKKIYKIEKFINIFLSFIGVKVHKR